MFSSTCRVARHTASLVAVLLISTVSAQARVYYAAEMNTEQLRALDKSRTVVVLPGGILEEHGPFLPSYTDGYVTDRLTQDVSDGLVERGWDVVIFPPIPLGSGGVNEVAAKYPYPGTYVVRLNTFRAIYMDLADELGEAGFKWIFVIHTHGAPNHNRALDQACDYFTETYRGRMVHLTGAGGAQGDDPTRFLSEQAKREDNGSGHAGINETSLILFLRPDLVDPAYLKAPAFTTSATASMIDVANRQDWTGYFGAPRYSSAEYGGRLYKASAARHLQQAVNILEGRAPAAAPRRGGPTRPADEASITRDRMIEQRQQDFLKKYDMR